MTRSRIITAVLTSLAVAALCWSAIWQGGADDLAQAETRLDEVSARETLVRARLNAAKEFTQGGATARTELDALLVALPDETDLGKFVAAHDTMATAAGVRVESLTPDEVDGEPQSAPAGTEAVGIEILVHGSTVATRAYQEGLQDLGRAVAIDEMEQTNEGTDLVSLRLRLRIFSVAETR